MEIEPRLVLCQDCVRIERFTEARHDGKERCECGGDYCGCDGCDEEAKKRLVQALKILADLMPDYAQAEAANIDKPH